MKQKITPEIENRGSLLTYKDGDKSCCFWYIFFFDEKGAFESSYGKLGVTKEEADKHNQCLSQAEIEGLDKNCEIGMGGMFYFIRGKVQTFIGVLVSDKVHLSASGRGITFLRNGKQYRGTLQKDADCFNFRRVS